MVIQYTDKRVINVLYFVSKSRSLRSIRADARSHSGRKLSISRSILGRSRLRLAGSHTFFVLQGVIYISNFILRNFIAALFEPALKFMTIESVPRRQSGEVVVRKEAGTTSGEHFITRKRTAKERDNKEPCSCHVLTVKSGVLAIKVTKTLDVNVPGISYKQGFQLVAYNRRRYSYNFSYGQLLRRLCRGLLDRCIQTQPELRGEASKARHRPVILCSPWSSRVGGSWYGAAVGPVRAYLTESLLGAVLSLSIHLEASPATHHPLQGLSSGRELVRSGCGPSTCLPRPGSACDDERGVKDGRIRKSCSKGR